MIRRTWSLRDIDRDAYGERQDRTRPAPSLSAGISKIFREAERNPTARKDTEAVSATEGLHTAALTRQRIRSLAADGVTQLTRADLKGMRPDQIDQARQEGRLLQIMSASDSEA